jgi:hypothetical protein
MLPAQLLAELAAVCSREASRLAEIGRTEDEARDYFYLSELARCNSRAATILGDPGVPPSSDGEHEHYPFADLEYEWRSCPTCQRAYRWSELKSIGVVWDRETGERIEQANVTCGCRHTLSRPLTPVFVGRLGRVARAA